MLSGVYLVESCALFDIVDEVLVAGIKDMLGNKMSEGMLGGGQVSVVSIDGSG